LEVLADLVEIEELVYLAEKVIFRDVFFQAKIIEQGVLCGRQLTHHGRESSGVITRQYYLMRALPGGSFSTLSAKPRHTA
jgi:hypothetical protein